jgi:hypothetical protein
MYGQFCGLARALELVGKRQGLLVVRENCGAARPTLCTTNWASWAATT